jgi:16S rRNA (guanine527-N7)-methyltransferase
MEIISPGQLWQQFKERHKLSDGQLDQFKTYYQRVIEANELFNITAITQLDSFIAYHFDDSLVLDQFSDLNSLTTLADIGTGAGFPGLAVKIAYPHLNMILIEVSHKKRVFLESLIEELQLDFVEIYPNDWRTFLRKTEYPIELFCSRASLHTDELMRMFKPGSPYNQARLVYWGATSWQPEHNEQEYLEKIESYTIKNKRRQLLFFRKTS